MKIIHSSVIIYVSYYSKRLHCKVSCWFRYETVDMVLAVIQYFLTVFIYCLRSCVVLICIGNPTVESLHRMNGFPIDTNSYHSNKTQAVSNNLEGKRGCVHCWKRRSMYWKVFSISLDRNGCGVGDKSRSGSISRVNFIFSFIISTVFSSESFVIRLKYLATDNYHGYLSNKTQE